uniref:Uncharacterized protein n=1 Tax=Vitrella brassicaformis TaxID=1169539 RepID=A0A7S1P7G4_9ALVE|mmetsp:Transcript_35216/g.87444  ORF Transcript_35216/g.87444 Transcript_35216/m.87444 type:complete len:483 (+) Transcript_35216:874-2322(+)
MQFEQRQRRGSSKFDDHYVALKCFGSSDHVISAKASGKGKGLVMAKAENGVPIEALWKCSRPTKKMSLFEACAEGNKEAVLRAIKAKGVKCLEETDEEGFTPLHYAAQNGHEVIVREIVAKGGKGLIKKQTKVMNEPTVLHLAVGKGHVAIVTALLDVGGADLLTTLIDKNLRTAFLLAAWMCHLDAMRAMYAVMEKQRRGKTLLDQQARHGNYAIHYAAFKGHLAAIQQLIGWGGPEELDRRNKFNSTPFHKAATEGHLDAMRAMRAMHAKKGKPLLDQEDNDGSCAIHYAAWKGYKAMVIQLIDWGGVGELEKKGKNQHTPFHLAAQFGQVDVMEVMYAKGGKGLLEQKGKNGMYAIHWAAVQNHVAVVKKLFEWGGAAGELERRKDNDNTAWLNAASCGHVDVMEAMYAAAGKTLLDQQNRNGYCAIHFASQKGHVEAVKLLVSWGGTEQLTTKKTTQGKTPMDLAQSDEMRKLIDSYK